MKSIILYEGSSDFILLQYYMRTVNQWEHDKNNKIRFTNAIARNCVLTKADNMLCIAGCGGCSRIIPALSSILDRNSISAENEAFDNTYARNLSCLSQHPTYVAPLHFLLSMPDYFLHIDQVPYR